MNFSDSSGNFIYELNFMSEKVDEIVEKLKFITLLEASALVKKIF